MPLSGARKLKQKHPKTVIEARALNPLARAGRHLHRNLHVCSQWRTLPLDFCYEDVVGENRRSFAGPAPRGDRKGTGICAETHHAGFTVFLKSSGFHLCTFLKILHIPLFSVLQTTLPLVVCWGVETQGLDLSCTRHWVKDTGLHSDAPSEHYMKCMPGYHK